jgi:hypothetical protein
MAAGTSMESQREQSSASRGEGPPPARRGSIAYIVFKMFAISAMVGMGVFLIIMGGLHPAALLKANLFTAADSPQAFRLAWQSGAGAGLITFAILWLKLR